jgi:hypothetical protein
MHPTSLFSSRSSKGKIKQLLMALWLTTCIMVLDQGGVAVAQSSLSEDRAVLKPLGELLTPEGRLNLRTGFRGTLDLTGWRIKDGASPFWVGTP